MGVYLLVLWCNILLDCSIVQSVHFAAGQISIFRRSLFSMRRRLWPKKFRPGWPLSPHWWSKGNGRSKSGNWRVFTPSNWEMTRKTWEFYDHPKVSGTKKHLVNLVTQFSEKTRWLKHPENPLKLRCKNKSSAPYLHWRSGGHIPRVLFRVEGGLRISVINMSNVFWNIYIYNWYQRWTFIANPVHCSLEKFFSLHSWFTKLGWIFVGKNFGICNFQTFEKTTLVKFPIADVFFLNLHSGFH